MNRTLPSEQEVDQLLDDFFKSEMPHAWPAFEPPVRQVLSFRPAAPRRRFVLGSRVALAASVALLMACGWLLSGSFDGPTRGKPALDVPRDGDANLEHSRPRNVPLQPPMKQGQPEVDPEINHFLSR